MQLKFNDFANIPPGVYEITVEVRQESTANVLSEVAYTEKFKLHVLKCLTEQIEKDMVETNSKAFFETHENSTKELRFGSGFSKNIEFHDNWKFPQADGMCAVHSY